MKKRALAILLAAVMALAAAPTAFAAAAPSVTIKEQYLFKGIHEDQSWCDEASWSSPVVADLDGDGKLEVVNAAASLYVMDAATGSLKWRVNSGKDRSTAFVQTGGKRALTTPEVADIDGDGKKEIVVVYENGTVSVLDSNGYFKKGWPQQITVYGDWGELGSPRALAVGDLDGDGKMEIVVGVGVSCPQSVWVYHADGTLADGWPQLDDAQNARNHSKYDQIGNAYSYGIYADGIVLGDLDGDGTKEIICTTDNPYMNAYHADGTLVTAGRTYGGRAWGLIAFYEDYSEEIRGDNKGWGNEIKGFESRAQLYRAELGHTAPIYTDVDGDGKAEIVVTALMMDRTVGDTTGKNLIENSKYMTAFILNSDRTRYVNYEKGFDWTTPPTELSGTVGGPLKQHDPGSMVASVKSVPVAADLDGDGCKEILFNAYDGKLHCFALDSTTEEYGSWPFTMPKSTASVYEYATPPACVDLDGDGNMEVVFASWTDNADGTLTHVNGALYVLSSDGRLLAKKDLHDAYNTKYYDNEVLAAPTVADVDRDGRYEVLLNTTSYALCAYEITAQKPARIAYSTTQNVLVNGSPVKFETYALKDANGNDTNYVKVRDVAYVLNSTGSRFNVGWDGAVNLEPGKSYTANGSEMHTPFSGNRTYEVSPAQTKVNGSVVKIDSIVLTDNAGGGYTYYKLRDLGTALGFTVDWTAEKGVFIDTK